MDGPGIDDMHTRAICDEIGERLRTLLKSSTPDDTTDLEDRLDQLASRQGEDRGNS
jgi:hypothetical protein